MMSCSEADAGDVMKRATNHVRRYRIVTGAAENVSDEHLITAFTNPQVKHVSTVHEEGPVSSQPFS